MNAWTEIGEKCRYLTLTKKKKGLMHVDNHPCVVMKYYS